jgi:hypothetical protein
MAEPKDPLNELLLEAKQLARYGALTGKIRDTSLLAAIADVDRVESPQWKDKRTQRLLTEMSDAVGRIAPVTLNDIRGWDPNRAKRFWIFQFHPTLIVLSCVLMFATVFVTHQYNRGVIINEQINELRSENASWLFNKTLLDAIGVSVGDNPDQERYIEYIHKLRELNGRSSSYTREALNWVAGTDPTRGLASAWNLLFYPQPFRSDLPQQNNCPDQEAARTITASVVSSQFQVPPARTAIVTDTAAPSTAEEQAPSMAKVLHRQITELLCENNIGVAPDHLSLVYAVRSSIEAQTALLALWVLPALYGALGASVFYMRRVLDPTLPDPPVWRLIYRIALGGFAGIILGWFWKPQVDLDSTFGNIGIDVFGWAFLIGFSVEVFFTLLDRLVNLMSAWARSIGIPRGTSTSAPAQTGQSAETAS